MPEFLALDPGEHVIRWRREPAGPEHFHEFDGRSVGAINAALATGRPLLVRGEPGLGKTQLAEAAARKLQRAFVSFTVNSRTEHTDLLWRYDAVRRLAAAQLFGAVRDGRPESFERLAERNYVFPGPLWWALDAEGARQAVTDIATAAGELSPQSSDSSGWSNTPLDLGDNEANLARGWVVLIDEIDKAETSVPNGLLEALGSLRFVPQGRSKPVTNRGVPPLVVITTNQERRLPPAFVRRCVVLQLTFPPDRESALGFLYQRGDVHFRGQTTDEVLRKAAELLWQERERHPPVDGLHRPGQAEYLDLVRAVVVRHPDGFEEQLRLLEDIWEYVLKKNEEF